MKNYKKNYLKSFFLLGAILTITSCSESFLSEDPDTFVSPPLLLVNEAGAQTYLNGAYDAVQQSIAPTGGSNPAPWSIYWGTTAADEVVFPNWGGERKLIYLHQVTPTTGAINQAWVKYYESLNRINSVVDRVGAMSSDQIDSDLKNQYVAEAKFLRTTVNFALVSSWENIPLMKNEVITLENINVTQAAPSEVYDFMVADLISALPYLPTEQGGGRVTAGAANALLGKIYLQMTGFPLNQTDKFPLAEQALKKVMDSGVYDLLPDYASIFDLDNEQSQEMIFAISLDGPALGEGGLLGFFFGPQGSVQNGGGWGTCHVNHSFADSYDIDTDVRMINNIARHNANNTDPETAVTDETSWTVGKNTWRGWKWHAESPNGYANDSPFDYPYIRYADVLLLYAEALNGQNKLTQGVIDNTVNRLRTRAGLSPAGMMTLGSQEDNATELLSERRKELCFEGWRRNDLIRFGKYAESISGITQGGPNAGDPITQYEDFEIRWPIPDAQMQLNPNLIQNPGY
ncbi:RagB/SusD family nutrient uptake outer membrane protein [Maribacter aquivivus]|uniref:RagB/SusD family nutrient uptake outer membrane protein n=1 Tax=Maribacter aquivivus TaxID=228958 RepID=UPI00248FBDF1|nr:RagB/SusD family nutrient uptake outer membrane protein [Maribacter aquivivus]